MSGPLPTTTDRDRQWAATMTGHPGADHGVQHAHPGALGIGRSAPRERVEREADEDASLAAGATRALGGGDRARPEDPDPLRTCFERDRDRILHASAFRRLSGKTQVFIFPADHQRTRLTHALKVAQVATALADALGLNRSLTEAIALGHDCGHGPGGHASETPSRPTFPAAGTTLRGVPTWCSLPSTSAMPPSTASETTPGQGRPEPPPRAKSWPGPIDFGRLRVSESDYPIVCWDLRDPTWTPGVGRQSLRPELCEQRWTLPVSDSTLFTYPIRRGVRQ